VTDDTSGTRLVLLGTAGGPLPSPLRSGIAQAVVVAGRVYLVDCGGGVTRQLRRARLLRHLHQVFLTHLHSDHDCDYFNLFLLGWPILQRGAPVDVYGPGRAGRLPAPPADAPPGHHIPVINPANPTPGLLDVTRSQIEAHAYDINIRMREAGRADLTELLSPHEIPLRPGLAGRPAAPPMDPILVVEDDRVRVTAVLVDHAPVFPAFAYRFDSDDGSVVISGDTAPCSNLIALARGTDILVHEVFADDAAGAEAPDDWEARQRERHRLGAHTPLSAVGRVAADSGARRLVLTHFLPGDDALADEHWIRGVGGGFHGEVVAGRDLLELEL
jgi:ribonuclease BN (tRNA processing enzyme)